jgi:hypothetical protein
MLLVVQESLSKKPPSPSRWRRKAWVLALLNLLLAITLFTNIRLYQPVASPGDGSLLGSWLRAFWVALTFVWLLLQLYPVALLLEQEDERLRAVAWRNAIALFASNPRLTLILTTIVLIIAVVGAVFPELWLSITGALLVAVCVSVAGYLFHLYRERTHTARG